MDPAGCERGETTATIGCGCTRRNCVQLLDDWDALEHRTKSILHNMGAYIASIGVAMLDDDTGANASRWVGHGRKLYNVAKDWSKKTLDTMNTVRHPPRSNPG